MLLTKWKHCVKFLLQKHDLYPLTDHFDFILWYFILFKICTYLFSDIIPLKKHCTLKDTGSLWFLLFWKLLTWGGHCIVRRGSWCFLLSMVLCLGCGRHFCFWGLQHGFLLISRGPVHWLQTDEQIYCPAFWKINFNNSKYMTYSFYRIIQSLPVVKWNSDSTSFPKIIVFSFGFIAQNLFGFLQLLEICHWNREKIRMEHSRKRQRKNSLCFQSTWEQLCINIICFEVNTYERRH